MFSIAIWAIVICLAFSQIEELTFKLSQSTADLQFWTAPPTTHIFKDLAIPVSPEGSFVPLYSAKNEFEPCLVIVNPSTTQQVTVNAPSFANTNIGVEMFQVKYIWIETPTDYLGHQGDWPDILWPIEDGDDIQVTQGENTAFWISIHVPFEGVESGDYSGSVEIGGVAIPINLHVFDFQIPKKLSVKSQMNWGYQVVLNKYGIPSSEFSGENYWFYVNKTKKFFLDHRLAPYGPLWPAGINLNQYDCEKKVVFDDYGIWGFEEQAQIALIDGFDGVTFPSIIGMSNVGHGSDDPRPEELCGVQRKETDFLATGKLTKFNAEYATWLKALEKYIEQWDMLDVIYLYPFDEPNQQSDYNGVAWFSAFVEKYAPKLDFFVSEPPRKEIYDHPDYPGSKIDIWMPVYYQLDPVAVFQRKHHCSESVWMYFLYGDRPPLSAPITIDHPPIESKLTGWIVWKYRIDGILYYSFNGAWSDTNPYLDPNRYNRNGEQFMVYPPSTDNTNIEYGSNNHRFVPSVRFELMRDSLEDYEYFKLLNDGNDPTVADQNTIADIEVKKVIMGVMAANRDENFIYSLRKTIGQYLGGEVGQLPDLKIPIPHERAEGTPGNYYINFQDPSGEPSQDPLVVEGKTWIKAGWQVWDDSRGFGFFGLPGAEMTQYLSSAEVNDLQKSVIYDNNGRSWTFFFALPCGGYTVEVSMGWADRSYEYNRVYIQGIPFVDVEDNAGGYIVRSKEIFVNNYLLSLELGGYPSSGQFSMLNYLKVEANGKSSSEIDQSIIPPKPENCKTEDLYEKRLVVATIIGIVMSFSLLLLLVLAICGLVIVSAFLQRKNRVK